MYKTLLNTDLDPDNTETRSPDNTDLVTETWLR